jgi:hypothetical protein
MSFDEAVQKIEDVAESELKKKKISVIENEIWGEDTEISKTFIFIRNLLWGFIYYGIYKSIGFVFELVFKFKKCRNGAGAGAGAGATNSIISKLLCFFKMNTPSAPSMSNIINENICSPECSPKHKGIGLPLFLTNLSL